mgnify:CR=1 FL=1
MDALRGRLASKGQLSQFPVVLALHAWSEFGANFSGIVLPFLRGAGMMAA